MSMGRSFSERERRARAFSAAVRAVRRLRGLNSQETGRRMGLQRRAYERFEAGEGRLDLERIFLFAEATDSDPVAIVSSLFLDRPELSVQCADNKLQWVMALSLERFSRTQGDKVRALETATLIDVFERAFDELARLQDERDARARDWFAAGSDPAGRRR